MYIHTPLHLTLTHLLAVLRALISDGVEGLLAPLGLSLSSQNEREERSEESGRVEGASSRNRDTLPVGWTKSLTYNMTIFSIVIIMYIS